MAYDGRVFPMISSKTLRISPLPRQLAIDIVKRFELAHDAHMNDLQPIDVRLHPCRHVPRHRLPSFPSAITREIFNKRNQISTVIEYGEPHEIAKYHRKMARRRVEFLYVQPMDTPAVQLWLTFDTAEEALRARYSLASIGLMNKRHVEDVGPSPLLYTSLPRR
jgi:hypothetical protein